MVWGFWIGSGLGFLSWIGLAMQVIVMLCKSTVVVNCD